MDNEPLKADEIMDLALRAIVALCREHGGSWEADLKFPVPGDVRLSVEHQDDGWTTFAINDEQLQ